MSGRAGKIKFRPIVFLGPSLSRASASRILDAEFRPPIRSGDLDGITAPASVVIIDGQFGPGTTLSFCEVRRIIDRGVVLYGAASTGAKMAARFPDRMTGLGWVYEAFLDGRIRDDDDISVLYRPDTFAPLTIPVASVLCWLEHHLRTGQVDAATAQDAATAIRAIPLAQRDMDTIHGSLAVTLGAPRFAELLTGSGGAIGNIKAEDAILALRRITSETERPCW